MERKLFFTRACTASPVGSQHLGVLFYLKRNVSQSRNEFKLLGKEGVNQELEIR